VPFQWPTIQSSAHRERFHGANARVIGLGPTVSRPTLRAGARSAADDKHTQVPSGTRFDELLNSTVCAPLDFTKELSPGTRTFRRRRFPHPLFPMVTALGTCSRSMAFESVCRRGGTEIGHGQQLLKQFVTGT
jgi:hypothetical protein